MATLQSTAAETLVEAPAPASWGRTGPGEPPPSNAPSGSGVRTPARTGTRQSGGRPGPGHHSWAGASLRLCGCLLQAGPDGLDEQPGAGVVQVLPDVADHATERDAALPGAEDEAPAPPRMADGASPPERRLPRRELVSRRETAGYQQDPVRPEGLLGDRAGQRGGV